MTIRKPVAYAFVPKAKRKILRDIVRRNYMKHGGATEACLAAIKTEIEGYGNIIVWLTVISVLIQIAKFAMEYWDRKSMASPPESVMDDADDPFDCGD